MKLPTIEGGLVIGQSNAGFAHGEPGGPIIAHFDDDAQLYMLAGMAGGNAGIEMPAQFVPEIEAYREPIGLGQTPAGMLGFASYLLDQQNKRPPRPMALHSSFRGNSPLTDMFPGAGYHLHENAIAAQQAFHEAYSRQNLNYELAWIDIIQGEGGPFLNYVSLFLEYIEKVVPDFASSIGQERIPAVMFSQINSFTNAIQCNPVALDQYELARKLEGIGVHLVGPMYQYPFHDPGHLTDIGRMMHGEVRALVLHRAMRRCGTWNPLWPTIQAARLNNRQIQVDMKLPPDASALAFDSDWVPDVPDKGFIVLNGDGSAVQIRNVSINDNTILIELLDDINGESGTLEYATFNSPNVEWWASGRGALYAETSIPSPFSQLGYDVPKTIRHYCVTFSIPLVTH